MSLTGARSKELDHTASAVDFGFRVSCVLIRAGFSSWLRKFGRCRALILVHGRNRGHCQWISLFMFLQGRTEGRERVPAIVSLRWRSLRWLVLHAARAEVSLSVFELPQLTGFEEGSELLLDALNKISLLWRACVSLRQLVGFWFNKLRFQTLQQPWRR